MTATDDDRNLIKLYEYRITKQEELISRFCSGSYSPDLLSPHRDMICGLAQGDLKLLRDKLCKHKKSCKAKCKKQVNGDQLQQHSLYHLDNRQDLIEKLKEKARNSQVSIKMDSCCVNTYLNTG